MGLEDLSALFGGRSSSVVQFPKAPNPDLEEDLNLAFFWLALRTLTFGVSLGTIIRMLKV